MPQAIETTPELDALVRRFVVAIILRRASLPESWDQSSSAAAVKHVLESVASGKSVGEAGAAGKPPSAEALGAGSKSVGAGDAAGGSGAGADAGAGGDGDADGDAVGDPGGRAPVPTPAPSTVLEKAAHAAWCKTHMSKCESQGEKEDVDSDDV